MQIQPPACDEAKATLPDTHEVKHVNLSLKVPKANRREMFHIYKDFCKVCGNKDISLEAV